MGKSKDRGVHFGGCAAKGFSNSLWEIDTFPKTHALYLCLALVLSRTLAAQSFDSVRAFIRKQLVETQTPSIAVAVARDGKVLWVEGFGWADRENRIPATEHTMYSLASVSKPMTATGLMVLCQAGMIDLDWPINDYLGTAKLTAKVGDADGATVRRVANHTSGLPIHYQFFYADEPYRPLPMDETIRRYGILVTAPGEHRQYSNLGYGILGYVISRISGKAYQDFMHEDVFLPLGLTHTSVNIGPGLEKYQAVRYGTDGVPIPFYDFDHPGASAVWASAHDLVRFGMFHLKAHLPDQKPILSDENIDEMQKATVKMEENSGYGVGWNIKDDGSYRVVLHGGGMPGVATLLMLIPSEKIAVVALCNSHSELPERVNDEILLTLLPKWKFTMKSQPLHSLPPFRPTPALLGLWEGKLETYQGDHPFALEIFASGDVHAQLDDQLKTLLNNVRFQDGYLTGRMMGDIGTEDARRRPYCIGLSLKLRGKVLNGAAVAYALPEQADQVAVSRGNRGGNALASWLELKRQ